MGGLGKVTKFVNTRQKDFDLLKSKNLLIKLDDNTWQLKADPRPENDMHRELDLVYGYSKGETYYFPSNMKMAAQIYSFGCMALCSMKYVHPDNRLKV
jgi:hypothetical protein